jgi:hypothetical protein
MFVLCQFVPSFCYSFTIPPSCLPAFCCHPAHPCLSLCLSNCPVSSQFVQSSVCLSVSVLPPPSYPISMFLSEKKRMGGRGGGRETQQPTYRPVLLFICPLICPSIDLLCLVSLLPAVLTVCCTRVSLYDDPPVLLLRFLPSILLSSK